MSNGPTIATTTAGAAAEKALPRPQAVLFDVYDTLFHNPTDDWVSAFDAICHDQRLPFSGHSLWSRWKPHEIKFRQVRTNLQDPAQSPPFKTYEQAWTECFEAVFREAGVAGDAALAGRRSVEHMARRPIFPDTRPALATLEGRARLGVLSNADDAFVRPLLAGERLQLEAIESSESARVYKPAPAAFQHVLRVMGIAASHAWYVGDQLFDDVLGAHRVGMTTVWINRPGNPFAGHGPRPAATIADLRELGPLLDLAEVEVGRRRGQGVKRADAQVR
jgi:2-haloalkanoic acid dehalogenase type II